MRSWQTIRELLDRIEEEIALASGVLLTDQADVPADPENKLPKR